MRGNANRYDWAAYYADAYERERKKNIVLAGKISDAERRQADLNDNLNRIYANPFWKATSPFRKLYHAARGETERSQDADVSLQTNDRFLHYEREVRKQKHPYAEWIREENNVCYDSEVLVNGWQAVRSPESDIMLLTYGKGILDKSAIGRIKSCFNKNASCKIAYADEDFYWEDLS